MHNLIISLFFGLTVYLIVRLIFSHPYDDTDDKKNKKRSGQGLFTDHGTGCQYLSNSLFGGITPRLDKDGRHICLKK